MKKKGLLNFTVIILFYLNSTFSTCYAQISWLKNNIIRTGFVYANGSQNSPILIDTDYSYNYNAFKFSNNFKLVQNKKHTWELLIEPSYYKSEHQLINYWYIKLKYESDDAVRQKFLQLKSINEYVLNLGLMYRYYFNQKVSIYYLLNIGPMYIDTETERLAKGFAFNDVFGLGFNFKQNRFSFDLKTTFRHSSNANLQTPNQGINSFGVETGVYYELMF